MGSTRQFVLGAVVAAWMGACGGSTPPAGEPSARGAVDWKAMSAGQRLQHMKKVVAPTMKTVFQRFDAEEFEDFGCTTCHGEGAKAGRFTMPNPALPKLNAANGFQKQKAEHPKEVQFMMEKVVPEMATALGMQPYNPTTHEGFGCFNCHTEDK